MPTSIAAKTLQTPKGPYCSVDELLSLRFAAKDMVLSPKQLSRSLLSGSVRTRFRGRGMEFEEVRHYQPGDDIRSIDWRVTARTQVTHTKLYTEDRERPIMLMIDQRASMFFGSRNCFKSVTAAYTAGALAWAALQQNDRVGALIFNDTEERDIRAKRSRHTVFNIFHELQGFNHQLKSPVAPDDATPLSERLRELRRVTKPGHALMIISDFHDFDSTCEEQLYQLARYADITLCQISDPIERDLPNSGRLQITNGSQRQLLDTGNQRTREAFRERYSQLLESLQATATR
jgi:uncharacterized protein (DUF58 family)